MQHTRSDWKRNKYLGKKVVHVSKSICNQSNLVFAYDVAHSANLHLLSICYGVVVFGTWTIYFAIICLNVIGNISITYCPHLKTIEYRKSLNTTRIYQKKYEL